MFSRPVLSSGLDMLVSQSVGLWAPDVSIKFFPVKLASTSDQEKLLKGRLVEVFSLKLPKIQSKRNPQRYKVRCRQPNVVPCLSVWIADFQ